MILRYYEEREYKQNIYIYIFRELHMYKVVYRNLIMMDIHDNGTHKIICLILYN